LTRQQQWVDFPASKWKINRPKWPSLVPVGHIVYEGHLSSLTRAHLSHYLSILEPAYRGPTPVKALPLSDFIPGLKLNPSLSSHNNLLAKLEEKKGSKKQNNF
jgi:hypothetical protein